MAEPEALSLVESHLSRAVTNMRGSRDYYRRRSLAQTIATASLSAITTFLIALNEIYRHSYLVAVSLVTAGLATVTSSWMGWLGARRLWVSNNQALVALYSLRDRIDFDKAMHGEALEKKMIEGYQTALQSVISEANNRWEKIRHVADG